MTLLAPAGTLAQRAWAVKRVLELSFTHRMFGFDSVPSLDVEGRAFVTDVAVATSSLRPRAHSTDSQRQWRARRSELKAIRLHVLSQMNRQKGSFAPDMSGDVKIMLCDNGAESGRWLQRTMQLNVLDDSLNLLHPKNSMLLGTFSLHGIAKVEFVENSHSPSK